MGDSVSRNSVATTPRFVASGLYSPADGPALPHYHPNAAPDHRVTARNTTPDNSTLQFGTYIWGGEMTARVVPYKAATGGERPEARHMHFSESFGATTARAFVPPILQVNVILAVTTIQTGCQAAAGYQFSSVASSQCS